MSEKTYIVKVYMEPNEYEIVAGSKEEAEGIVMRQYNSYEGILKIDITRG